MSRRGCCLTTRPSCSSSSSSSHCCCCLRAEVEQRFLRVNQLASAAAAAAAASAAGSQNQHSQLQSQETPLVVAMAAVPLPRMTSFTLAVIPEANTVKDSCALPFGCIVRPLVPIIAPGPERIIPASFSDISRCESCGAYISPFCRFEQRLWRCAMCGQTHDLSTRCPSFCRASAMFLPLSASREPPQASGIQYRAHPHENAGTVCTPVGRSSLNCRG